MKTFGQLPWYKPYRVNTGFISQFALWLSKILYVAHCAHSNVMNLLFEKIIKGRINSHFMSSYNRVKEE